MRYLLLLVILFVLLSGCNAAPASTQGAGATVSVELAPTVSSTAASTVANDTPTPTHLPNAIPTDQLNTSVFHFYENNPVLQHSNNPNWDNQYIDPGAMVYQDGMFHMFFNGINGFPAPVGVGYATSPNGYEWTRQVSEPVLSAKALSEKSFQGHEFIRHQRAH